MHANGALRNIYSNKIFPGAKTRKNAHKNHEKFKDIQNYDRVHSKKNQLSINFLESFYKWKEFFKNISKIY